MALFGRKKPAPEPVAEPVAEAPLPRRTADEHRAALLKGVEALRPFGMQINDVSGLTLCEDIVSDLDLPMVSTARTSGYGVRAANIVGASELNPVELRVTGVVDRRDAVPTSGVAPGGCVLLAEGAPVPKGVDAVVPLADAQLAGRVVSFIGEAGVGQHISLRGSTLAEGAPLLTAGRVLDARAITLLAEVGLDKVLVRPQPRLVVLAVGEGLVAPGLPITAISQTYSASTSYITAAARADGVTVYPLDIIGRDASVLRQTLADQVIRADVIVVLTETDADSHLVADLLGDLGTVDLAHVLLDGGQPLAIGRLGDERLPVVVLPASPVRACVGYHLFVRPLLDRLGARAASPAPRVTAMLAEATSGDATNERYRPGLLDGGRVRLIAEGAEHAFDLFRADVLVRLPAGRWLEAGDRVDCLVLGGGAAADAPDAPSPTDAVSPTPAEPGDATDATTARTAPTASE